MGEKPIATQPLVKLPMIALRQRTLELMDKILHKGGIDVEIINDIHRLTHDLKESELAYAAEGKDFRPELGRDSPKG